MTSRASEEAPDDAGSRENETDHLSDVPDGSGCTEIWEHLSERRERKVRGPSPTGRDGSGGTAGADDESEP